ncbi:MAG TPA: hypothetical protein DIU35_08350 [Candidatus Latescibacteria bacterium]|nr:hypothetical protein [Candidatus Latescibacterota bacterium]
MRPPARRRNKRPQASHPAHLAAVAGLGCIICGRPAECHHVRQMSGMGLRPSDLDAIPLCPDHHRTGGYGTAVHAGRRAFARNFGSESDLLNQTRQRLIGDG